MKWCSKKATLEFKELGHFLPIQPLNIVSMTIQCHNKVKINIFIWGFWGNYCRFVMGKNKSCPDFQFALLDNNGNIGKLCLEISCSQKTFLTFSDVYNIRSMRKPIWTKCCTVLYFNIIITTSLIYNGLITNHIDFQKLAPSDYGSFYAAAIID